MYFEVSSTVMATGIYWLRSEKKANIDTEAPFCLWAKPTITKQKALFTIYWTYICTMEKFVCLPALRDYYIFLKILCDRYLTILKYFKSVQYFHQLKAMDPT